MVVSGVLKVEGRGHDVLATLLARFAAFLRVTRFVFAFEVLKVEYSGRDGAVVLTSIR